MRYAWLCLTVLPILSVQAAPPVAKTVADIENGLDTKPQIKISLERSARGPGEIIIDTPQSDEPPAVIAPIEFDSGKATIRYESLPILHSYGVALQGDRLKKLSFAIGGHTDSDGSEATNLLLSQRRAQAVQDYLVQQYRIQAWRLRVEPYGENKPLASNATPQGKAQAFSLSLICCSISILLELTYAQALVKSLAFKLG
jgi:outer membrane protein OmpA-like peptidoglycan-associated protein